MIDAIWKRRSCRKFKKEKVEEGKILEILRAGFFAPDSMGNKGLEFILIKDQTTKIKIFDIVGQDFVKVAPILVIPITDLNKTTEPIQDLSVATENILLEATAQGLGSVWKNINSDWQSKIRPLINLPENLTFINLIPIGYPNEELAPHNQKNIDQEKIHIEKY